MNHQYILLAFLVTWPSIFSKTSSKTHRLPGLWEENGKEAEEVDEAVYSDTWVLHIKGGSPQLAQQVADDHGFINHGPVGTLKDLYHFQQTNVTKEERSRLKELHTLLSTHPHVISVNRQTINKRVRRYFPDQYFTDPLYRDQWYLQSRGRRTWTICSMDVNVVPVWKKNITGKGVVVTVIDDGVEYTHKDLKRTYDPSASYDLNERDSDPLPRYSSDNINKHGTRVAGIIGAEVNNGLCGAGIAYNSRVGGIKILDGDMTDAMEASSLSFKPQYVDIYSVSWGPDDDGEKVDGPGPLTVKALQQGATYGRGGLGSIYVWATGNGGKHSDYCSCDGYVNSPYTISIGAIDDCGLSPWYAESCPGTMAVTFSSGSSAKKVTTTDLRHKCTKSFSGTSAATPIATAIFALALEANPSLTWRDLQHLIVHTSEVMPHINDGSWITNAAGHKVSSKFGFGSLNADSLVSLGTTWKSVSPQHVCEVEAVEEKEWHGSIEADLMVDGCMGKHNCIQKVEQLTLVLKLVLYAGIRGGLLIDLISPNGTVSPILRRRPKDYSRGGFDYWEFLTLFHWDETTAGLWKLKISHTQRYSHGKLNSWKLRFYGTGTGGTDLTPLPTKTQDKTATKHRDLIPTPSETQGHTTTEHRDMDGCHGNDRGGCHSNAYCVTINNSSHTCRCSVGYHGDGKKNCELDARLVVAVPVVIAIVLLFIIFTIKFIFYKRKKRMKKNLRRFEDKDFVTREEIGTASTIIRGKHGSLPQVSRGVQGSFDNPAFQKDDPFVAR